LDACFQILNATIAEARDPQSRTGTYMPVSIRTLRATGQRGVGRWSHALLTGDGMPGGTWLEADVCLLDEAGDVLVEARGVRIESIPGSTVGRARAEADEWFYELQWQLVEPADQTPWPVTPGAKARGTWLVFADGGGLGESLRALLTRCGEECVLVLPGEVRAFDLGASARPDPPTTSSDSCGPSG
jgi:hypothetical protein